MFDEDGTLGGQTPNSFVRAPCTAKPQDFCHSRRSLTPERDSPLERIELKPSRSAFNGKLLNRGLHHGFLGHLRAGHGTAVFKALMTRDYDRELEPGEEESSRNATGVGLEKAFTFRSSQWKGGKGLE